jgi:hypothetical protein
VECQSTWPGSDFTAVLLALNMMGTAKARNAFVTNATSHVYGLTLNNNFNKTDSILNI